MTNEYRSHPIWLKSEQVGLGPYVHDFVQDYWRWENDPGTILGFGRLGPESIESRTTGIEIQLKNSAMPRFTAFELASHKPIGVTTLKTDYAVRTTELVINVAPEWQGQGYGSQAAWLTLDYAFHVLSLRMVWLKVLSGNANAIKAYEKIGFKAAGKLRSAGYWLGKVCDELFMDMVVDDFVGDSVVLSQYNPTKDSLDLN
jgi:RimJ/RimL family protein N-acetyltransferase